MLKMLHAFQSILLIDFLGNVMDIYITFYQIIDDPVIGKCVSIENGFSFGRNKKESDIELFFDKTNSNTSIMIQEAIAKYIPNKI